jgi:hypothetical protein
VCACALCSCAQGACSRLYEAMHVCACLCVLVHKAHGHCHFGEAMHACGGERVLACTRRMVTVIAVRRCMRVWECVFGFVQGAWSL